MNRSITLCFCILLFHCSWSQDRLYNLCSGPCGHLNGDFGHARALCSSDDGKGNILVTYFSDRNQIRKADSSGAVVWEKTIENPIVIDTLSTANDSIIYYTLNLTDILMHHQNGYAAGGMYRKNTVVFNSQGTVIDVQMENYLAIIRFTTDGDITWSKKIPCPHPDTPIHIDYDSVTSQYLIAQRLGYLALLDTNGNVNSSFQLPGVNDLKCIFLSTGDIVCSGRDSLASFITRFTLSGNVIYSNYISSSSIYINGLAEAGNHLFFSSNAYTQIPSSSAMVAKLDSNGAFVTAIMHHAQSYSLGLSVNQGKIRFQALKPLVDRIDNTTFDQNLNQISNCFTAERVNAIIAGNAIEEYITDVSENETGILLSKDIYGQLANQGTSYDNEVIQADQDGCGCMQNNDSISGFMPASFNAMPFTLNLTGASLSSQPYQLIQNAIVPQYYMQCSRIVNSILEADKKPYAVYPNPCHGIISWQFNHPPGKAVAVSVTSYTGQTIKEFDSIMENNTLTIAFGKVPDGLYIITVANDNAQYSERIVIAR